MIFLLSRLIFMLSTQLEIIMTMILNKTNNYFTYNISILWLLIKNNHDDDNSNDKH